MDQRGKWAFWAAATGIFLLICLPSAYLVDALKRYRDFVQGVDPSVLRPVKVRFVPHQGSARGEPRSIPDFAEFSLNRPKAKTVALVGDFNGWREGALPLSRDPDGRWQIILPLTKGRHPYLFLVDGEPTLDPSNGETAEISGRRASIKVVR